MPSTDLKLAYLTIAGAADPRMGPGASYYAAQSFAANGIALDFIGPLVEEAGPMLLLKSFCCKTFSGARHLVEREPAVLEGYARQAATRLANSAADAVFSVGGLPLAHVETNKPLIFWADSTLQGLTTLVPSYHKLCEASQEFGHAAERALLERCSLAIYTSDWAARSATLHYGLDERKVRVVPFGPNLQVDRGFAEVESLVEARPRTRCRLLWVGTDWEGKGGPMAVAVTSELLRLGLNAELTVVGCQPVISGGVPDFVRVVGFLSKQRREARATLERLYGESHFLLLPSRIERSAVTCAEASSFGLPALMLDIGGTSSVLRDDSNGKLFDSEASASHFALYISGLFNNYDHYRELAKKSFHEYSARLSWVSAIGRVRQMIADALGPNGTGAAARPAVAALATAPLEKAAEGQDRVI